MKHEHNAFMETLDQAGHEVFRMLHEYIAGRYPEIQPFDIRPTSKNTAEWTLTYRKRPKTGKAVCTLQSVNGRLTVRFCFLSSMTHEFTLRQDEFTAKMKSLVLRQLVCCVSHACRGYGGNTPCAWRQNYWVNHRLIRACPYPWVYFEGLTEDDFTDIKLLIDLQMKHMTQNSKDIKGGTYAAENLKRCGTVRTFIREQTLLDVDTFVPSDYVKNQTRLDKYARYYHFVPMGANDGLWFFRSDRSVVGESCDALAYAFTKIPGGRYASVTIADPMSFSASRVWNYLCEWLAHEKIAIREIDLDAQTTAVCFAGFAMEDEVETMEMLVPIEG